MNLRKVALTELWAIDCQFLDACLLHAEIHGEHVARQVKLPSVKGSIAVLPIHGMISQRGSVWDEVFGGTAADSFAASYARAINDDRISAVVLDVDSPGGTVAGVEAAAELVYQGRQYKPTVAVANSQAASAAYWLASGADKIVAAPGSEVGSIGVFRMHEDVSEMLSQDGVKVTFLAMPRFKVEGNPYEPLTQAATEHNMAQVAETYEAFNAAVARNRGIKPSAAKTQFGEGRAFNARQAAAMGLVDRVATMSEILAELGAGRTATVDAATAEILSELCAVWESGIIEPLKHLPSLEIRKRRAFLMGLY